MLGWDVGTFEFMSDRILALNYHSHAKLKLRTGGSTGSISKTQCQKLPEGDGMFYDIAKKEGKNNVRLPIKFRYRSPVVFEFHTAGKRGAVAYATIWLHHLVDNETQDINIPIWTTKNGARLTQNYITETNTRAKEVPGLEDLEEIGRLQFRCRFKAGMDEDHETFVVDNDSRETFETWEACLAEGVRQRKVEPELPPKVEELHEQSLTEGRDVLKEMDPEERKKWLARDGQDWSGAFGENPGAYTDKKGRKRAEPGRDKPVRDPIVPGEGENDDDDDYDDDDNDDSTSDSEDLGVQDANNTTGGAKAMNGSAQAPDGDNSGDIADTEAAGLTAHTDAPAPKDQSNLSKSEQKHREKANKKSEKRKQRGLMQWKPMRNAAFAKDEVGFMVRRVKKRFTGELGGREPTVETETGT